MAAEITLKTLHADLVDLRRLLADLLRAQSEETEFVERTFEAERQIRDGEYTSYPGDEYLQLLDEQAEIAGK